MDWENSAAMRVVEEVFPRPMPQELSVAEPAYDYGFDDRDCI